LLGLHAILSLQPAPNMSNRKGVRLAQQFVGLAGRPDLAASPELQEALQAAVDLARATWPTVDLPANEFLSFLIQRIGATDDLLASLHQLHTSDLYLACGCARGDVRATAAFEHAFIPAVDSYLAGTPASAAFRDELRQALRERVLLARDGQAPRIALYTGRGPLGAWLRMVTARLAADLRRQRDGATRELDDASIPIDAADPELRYLKERYRPEFEAALEQACRELSAHDGTVMRLHFVDAMPLPAIARMYNVSLRTVQRWVAAAQAQIVEGVRRRLTHQLALSTSELDGLLALVASRLNISLHRLFAEPS
jgi:RNA polymerase sigma-70 factor (ECF subfamily)